MAGFPHIAVVDDEATIVDILSYSLQKKFPDARISGFDDADEAHSWLARNQVDLLLTDLNMPAVNGRVLVAMMEKITPLVPVIVISGAMPLNELKGMEQEFDHVQVFAKPLLTRDLVAGIETSLARGIVLDQARVARLSLASILHLLHLQSQTMQVSVQHSSGNGGVIMAKGEPMLVQFNGDQTEEALYHMLLLDGPKIKLTPTDFSEASQLAVNFDRIFQQYIKRREKMEAHQ